MKFPLSSLILTLLFFCISNTVFSQLNITQNNSAQALVQKLVGPGVTVSNASITSTNLATGFFHNISGTNIGLDSGIVLCNGRVKSNAVVLTQRGMDGDGITQAYTHFDGMDSASTGAFASTDLNLPGNPDLTTLLGDPTYDAIVLKFDFVPLGDTVKFRYVFSSEEYPDYPCADVNDAFAFFIEGPGFPVKTNIALIPGTTAPVTIDNINELPGCGLYPQFFRTNRTNVKFTYNGHTTIFTAVAKVQPCQTYSLTLVIADVGDHIYDSGVFIEAGSLSSNSIGITNLTQVDPVTGISYLVEGCATGAVNVRRPRKDPSPLVVNLSYGGSAINGIDVSTLPSSVTIPANDSFVRVNINPIMDLVPEGIETLKIYALAGCAAGTPTDSTVIQLRDYDILSLVPDTANICRGSSVQLIATTGYTTYQWNANPTLSSTSIRDPIATPVNSTTTYICTANVGTCNAQDSVLVKWKDIELISKQDVLCQNANTGNIRVSAGREWIAPQFSLDGIVWQADSNFYNLPVGTYRVKARDINCVDSITVNIVQSAPDLLISNIDNIPASCSGNADGRITITPAGGSSPYTYSINGINFQANNFFNLSAGSYTVVVKDNNGCTSSQPVVVDLNNSVTVDAGDNTTICEGKSMILPAVSNASSFLWTPPSTLSNATVLTPSAAPVNTTKYFITATTGICSRIDSITISVLPAPIPDAG